MLISFRTAIIVQLQLDYFQIIAIPCLKSKNNNKLLFMMSGLGIDANIVQLNGKIVKNKLYVFMEICRSTTND